MFRKSSFVTILVLSQSALLAQTYIGNYSTNQYDSNSISNSYGQYGSSYGTNSVNNNYSQYGSPYSSKSATNRYATDTPKLYDQNGSYKGKLSSNSYDPDSISNPYGRYGSKYSPESVNNPFGAGSPYSTNTIRIYGQ